MSGNIESIGGFSMPATPASSVGPGKLAAWLAKLFQEGQDFWVAAPHGVKKVTQRLGGKSYVRIRATLQQQKHSVCGVRRCCDARVFERLSLLCPRIGPHCFLRPCRHPGVQRGQRGGVRRAGRPNGRPRWSVG